MGGLQILNKPNCFKLVPDKSQGIFEAKQINMMPGKRWNFALCTFQDRYIVLSGGYTNNDSCKNNDYEDNTEKTCPNEVYSYDTVKGQWNSEFFRLL